MTEIKKTDVFISGGGPTGLLIAYALARQGVDTLFVGKDPSHFTLSSESSKNRASLTALHRAT